jgi:hypothetical protein
MSESRISNFNIQNFAAQLGNTAKANNFAANITLPQALSPLFPESDRFIRKIMFAIKATTVPSDTIASIDLPFRGGLNFRVPGDRDRSGVWETTIRYDIDNIAHNIMERWSDAINGHIDGDALIGDEEVLSSMGVGEVYQLSQNGRIIKGWTFTHIWPSSVGNPSYDWSSTNAVIELPVSFTYLTKETKQTRNNTISEDQLLSGSLIF